MIKQGDALTILKTMDSESITCCITSPPYWALRDYGIEGQIWDGNENCQHKWEKIFKPPMGGKNPEGRPANVGSNRMLNESNLRGVGTYSDFCSLCGAWRGSLGLEPTFQLYIKHLCDIFDEIKRVLRKDGTCWVNLGDSYYSISGGQFLNDNLGSKDKNLEKGLSQTNKLRKGKELQQKNLCNIPARFSIEMQNRGWILRNTLIWHKPNCMPSSVKDRFTVDFEYIFFFVKNKEYWFETQYERGEMKSAGSPQKDTRETHGLGGGNSGINLAKARMKQELKERGYVNRNKRCVWKITTKPFSGAKILADYVGVDGRPYRASLDCPIDEHRLYAQKRQKGECDEQQGQKKKNIQHISKSPVPKRKGVSSSSLSRNEDYGEVSAKAHEHMTQNISDHRTSETSLDKDVSQNHHHNKDIEQKSSCNSDYSSPDNSEIATLHNKQNHKNTSLKEECDNPCDKTSFHKSGKQLFDHSFGSYKDYITAKCTCQVISTAHFAVFPEELVETPMKAGCPPKGTCLDPFCGSGTVGVVAKKLNRQFIGIELNPEYVKMAEKRIANTQETFL